MTKLNNGKWNHQVASVEEVKEAVDQIKALISKYHWEDKRVYISSHSSNIMKLVESDGWNNFKSYTFSSKQLIIGEINIVIDYINIWESKELEEKVTVKMRNGEIKELAKSIADELIEIGLAENI